MDNRNFRDIMTLLKSTINVDNFTLENIKDIFSNKIFAIKSYEDGSSYCGFLDEKKDKIVIYAIYKDLEGRKLMGIFYKQFEKFSR